MSTDHDRCGQGNALPGRLAALAGWLAVAWFCLTLLGLDALPFQDHPTHRVRVQALVDFAGAEAGPARYLALNFGLAPYILADCVVLVLQFAVGLDLAYRLLYCAYAVGFFAGYRYLLAAANPPGLAWSLLAPLLLFNTYLLLGNENFLLSLPLLWFLLGYYCRYREGATRSARLALAGLVLVLYYTHFLTFLFAGFFVTVIMLQERRGWRAWLRLFALPALLFVGWLLEVWLLPRETGDVTFRAFHWFASAADQVRVLGEGLFPVLWHGRPEGLVLALLLAMLLPGLRRRSVAARGLAWGVAGALLSVVISPEQAMVLWPSQRLLFCCLFLLPLLSVPTRRQALAFVFLALPALVWLGWFERQVLQTSSATVAAEMRAVADWPGPPPGRVWRLLPVFTDGLFYSTLHHRVYDYYAVRHCALTPYQYFSPAHALRFRSAPELACFHDDFRANLAALDAYDGVIVVGRDNRGPTLAMLARRGLLVAGESPAMLLLLRR